MSVGRKGANHFQRSCGEDVVDASIPVHRRRLVSTSLRVFTSRVSQARSNRPISGLSRLRILCRQPSVIVSVPSTNLSSRLAFPPGISTSLPPAQMPLSSDDKCSLVHLCISVQDAIPAVDGSLPAGPGAVTRQARRGRPTRMCRDATPERHDSHVSYSFSRYTKKRKNDTCRGRQPISQGGQLESNS